MARFLTIVPVLALFGLLATAVAVPLEAHTTNIVTADKYGKVLDKYEDVHSTKSSYKQKPFTTCPDQYALWKAVTSIRICQDDDGFVTGLQYFNEHPRKHYDPVTVCRTDGAASCTTFELPMDPSTGTAVTVTNVKVAKLEHGGDTRVAYLAFGLSDGTGFQVGDLNGSFGSELKMYSWYQEHKPAKVCGLNGFVHYGLVCDKHTGYLAVVKPCYSCEPKSKFKSFKAKSDKETKYVTTVSIESGSGSSGSRRLHSTVVM